MNSKIGLLYLLLVAALWGLTFPLIAESMETQDPFLFVSIRFSLAAVFVLPYFLWNIDRKTLIVGSLLGVMQLAIYLSQAIGLETIDPSRAAFLTGVNVLLVPFISPLLRMGFPTRHDFFSAVICCVGIFVLTECNIGEISAGDGWILVGAVLIGLSIVYIGRHAKSDMDPFMLSYSQIVMTALFSWVPTFFFSNMEFTPFLSVGALPSLLVCSLLATIVAITLQAKYQRYVSLQNTALIFSLEPVFAAVFDFMLRGVMPSLYTLGGGMIILFSIVYLEVWKPKVQVSISDTVITG